MYFLYLLIVLHRVGTKLLASKGDFSEWIIPGSFSGSADIHENKTGHSPHEKWPVLWFVGSVFIPPPIFFTAQARSQGSLVLIFCGTYTFTPSSVFSHFSVPEGAEHAKFGSFGSFYSFNGKRSGQSCTVFLLQVKRVNCFRCLFAGSGKYCRF